MRLALLVVSALSLFYLDSCREVVGPVPEFQYEFSDFDDIGLTPFDTTLIVVGNVEIIAGGVSNAAFDALTSETPANLSNYAAIYAGVISVDQQTYWQGQTQASILAAISSGDATATAQLASLETAFSGNATLSTFLPNTTLPSVSSGGNVVTRASRSSNSSTGDAIISPPSGTENEIDDCRQAAQDAFDEVVAQLEADRITQLNNIEIRFQNQSQVLAANAAAERTASSDRNNERLNAFLSTYNNAIAYVESLVTQGDLTSEEGDDLSLFILNVYALSIQASYVVFEAELALIDQAEIDLLADLTTQRDEAIASVESDYASELSDAQIALESSQNGCHNQGAGTGM